MEEIKKQILLINLANYNETVNNMSKFKLNDREINLFCDIMQQFAEKYHAEQLRIHDVVGQSEQLSCGRNITTCVFYKEGSKCSNLEYCKDQTT